MKIIKIFLLFLLFYVSGCKSFPEKDTFENGMVYSGDNEPLPGVDIYVDNKFYRRSDLYGHFYLEKKLLQGNRCLKFQKEGYEIVFLETEECIGPVFFYVKMRNSKQLVEELEKSIRKNSFDKAFEDYKKIISIDSKNQYAKFLYAIALLKSGNRNKAKEILSEIEIHDRNEYVNSLLLKLEEKPIDEIS